MRILLVPVVHDDNLTGSVDRRTLIRGLGVAATLGTVGVGTATAATDDPQTAIDAAEPGETVTVAPGTYDGPLAVDVPNLTVQATPPGDATVTGSDDTTGAAVSVEADGVTLRGLRVTNPGGLLGVKVGRGLDDVTVADCLVEDVGPTGRLGVTGIAVGRGDHDGIELRHNVIRNLDQETTDDSGFPTTNGILFDADNAAPGTLSNASVVGNEITGLESDVAPIGVVLQHELVGVAVVNNHVHDLVAADGTDSDPTDEVDFGFTFAQGINVASPATSDSVVVHNRIEDVTSAETIFGEAVKIDGDGSGVTFRANQLLAVVGLNNQNGADDAPTVDAKNNYWGSRRGPETASENIDADDDARADVVGNVVSEPFLRRAPGGRR